MIQIDNLSFRFKNGQSILNDISVNFLPGNIYGLLGKNGDGKSSLLYIIMGLLRPNSGSCITFGKQAFDRLPSILDEVFLVPDILPNHSPGTVNSFARVNGNFFTRFDPGQFSSYLEEFKLDGQSPLVELSKGQLRSFFICFGIATNCKILLLDEAADGLDIESKEILKKLLISTFNEEKTIIISTHQIKDLESVIDRVVILDDNKIAVDKALYDIVDRFALRLTSSSDDLSLALYTEQSYKGRIGIFQKHEEQGTEIPLDLFYKAFLKNKGKITSILNN